jgi:predicted transposase YbfD/YdcC
VISGVVEEGFHYFIFNQKDMTAESFMKARRKHWGIENRVHWVLDVIFDEDHCREAQ